MTNLIAPRTEFAPARFSADHNDRFSDDGTAVLADVPGSEPRSATSSSSVVRVSASVASPLAPRIPTASSASRRARRR